MIDFSPLGLLLLIASFMRARGGSPFVIPPAGDITPNGPVPPPMPRPPPGTLPAPVPFPQVPATDLPAFPSGWEYDQPPPAEVVHRAYQLIDQLWAQGVGAHVAEQTGGRWITYKAEYMKAPDGTLSIKGVTAWRIKAGAQPGPSPTPGVIPASTTIPGGGMSPADIQTALNNAGATPPLVVDGVLGAKSKDAIKWFQSEHPPLAIDGIAGAQTQAILKNYSMVAVRPPPVPVPSVVMPTARPAPAPGPAPAPLPPIPATYVQPAPTGPAMTPQQIQVALNAAGANPPLVVDGKLGPSSKAATVAFQREHPPLAADGIAGPQTQSQLRPYLASSPVLTATRPTTLPAIPATYVQPPAVPVMTPAQIQAALNAAGAMPPLVVDGQLGAKSKAATLKFQQTHPPLTPDGIAGPQTQAVLRPYLGASA